MGKHSNALSALLLCVALAAETSTSAAMYHNETAPTQKIRRNYDAVADGDNNGNSDFSGYQPFISCWNQLQPSSQASSKPAQEWQQPQKQPAQGWEQQQWQPAQGWKQQQLQPAQEWEQQQWQPAQESKQQQLQPAQEWEQQQRQPSWSNQQPSSSSYVGRAPWRRQFVVADSSGKQQTVIVHQAKIAANGTVVDENDKLVPFSGVGYIDSDSVIHFHQLANGPASQLLPSTASRFQNRKMFRNNGDDNLDDNKPLSYIQGEAVILAHGFVVLPNGEIIPFDGVGTINGSGILIFHQIVNKKNVKDSSLSKLLRRQAFASSGAVRVVDPVTIFNGAAVNENGIVQFDGLCFVDANNLLYYYPRHMFSDSVFNFASQMVSPKKLQIDVHGPVDVDDDNNTAWPTGFVLGKLDADGNVSGPNVKPLHFSGVGSVDENGVLLFHPVISITGIRQQSEPVQADPSQQQQQQPQPAPTPVQPAPQQSQPQIQANVVSDSDEEGDDWQQFNVFQPRQQQQQQQQMPQPHPQQQHPEQQDHSADSKSDSGELNGDVGQQPHNHPGQSAPVDPNASVSSLVPEDVGSVDEFQAASGIDDSDDKDDGENDGRTHGGSLSRAQRSIIDTIA